MYVETTGTRKILQLKKRIRGVSGGTSASKTVSILLWLIHRAQSVKEKEIISVVSESMPHLRKGAMRDFLDIMQIHNYFKNNQWEKTNSVYNFEIGSIIEFFGVENWEKVKGARRDILFINEANHIPFETYNQLEVRTKKIVWLDWNPESEFWWYTDILPKIDCDFITLTYKDNEALDKEIVKSIESRKDNRNWFKIYGEGQLGEIEGKIYKDWATIDEVPHEARLERYGLDFGYSNNPTAIVAIYKYNNGFILDQIAYQKGLSNKQIADILLNVPPALVVADSAEPKSIDELVSYGISVVGSLKGQGSVLQGIQYVQQQRISVTKRSLDILKEYRNFLWQTDKNGKIINEPGVIFRHAMDAVSYGTNSLKPYEEDIFIPDDTKMFREGGFY